MKKNFLINSRRLDDYKISEKCPNCGEENATLMTTFFSYIQLLFLIFPFGKIKATTCCGSCGFEMDEQSMPKNFRKTFHRAKHQKGTPTWVYSGFFILAFGAIAITVATLKATEYRTRLEAPSEGDYYEIQTKKGNYTLYKVRKVEGEKLFISPSQYEAITIDGIDNLYGKSFHKELIILTKKQILEMYNKGAIIAAH